MKRYYYFVAYSTSSGYGNIEICVNNPITDMATVRYIASLIRDDLQKQYKHNTSPVISNYILLRVEE